MVRSKIPFGKTFYHIENSQSICKANQLTGFYVIQGFTEKHLRADYNIVNKANKSQLNVMFTLKCK